MLHAFSKTDRVIHSVEPLIVKNEALYYGHFTIREDEDTYRPSEGDVFNLSLNENESWDSKGARYWTFEVTPSVGFGPRDAICGVVARPYFRPLSIFDAGDPQTIKLGKKAIQSCAIADMMEDGGNMCRLQLRDSNKVAKNIRKHLDLLVFAPEKSPATEHNRRIYQVMLARRIDQLKAHDFFHVP